jgi:hypothetical protein
MKTAPFRIAPLLSCFAVLLVAGHCSSLLGAPVTEVIVKTGDQAPDKDGTFNLGLAGDTTAVLNNCGWAAFRGSLSGTNGSARIYGEFLADGTTRIQVARTNDPAPGGSSTDTFHGFSNVPALNDAGQVLFEGASGLTNQNDYCLFRSDPLTRLFDGLGQAAPGGNGTVFLGSPTHEWPAFNNTGLAAFVARLTSTQGGSNDDSAIYRTSTPGKLTQIAREGQPLPEGNGTFGEMVYGYPYGGIVPPAMNATGQVAFVDRAGIAVVGIYRGDGKTPIKIARIGDPLPGGGTLSSFSSGTTADINDLGEVVFAAVDNSVSAYGIFKWSGGALRKIARYGDTIPNSSDTIGGTDPSARINKAGQVAFVSRVNHTNPNGSYFAMFRGDGTTTKLIAREGQATPVRSGIFSALNNSTFCVNASGQIAFTAGLDVDLTNNVPIEEYGVYFFDGSQILQVARTNDTFVWPDGKSGKITNSPFSFQLSGTVANNGFAPPLERRSGLNDAGQVVFGLTTTLSDNTQRYGIAIWSPTLKLLCASSRKSQGGKNFDVDLPLTGKLGVECRSGGAQGNFTLVLRFTNKLNSVGSASVTTGVGSVSGTPTVNGNTMTVNLTGVANAQKIVVTLSNVKDKYGRTLPSATVPLGILLGDVDGNKTVNNTDVNLVNAKIGAKASLANFRNDVDASGSIAQDDVTVTQGQVGTSIP